MSVRLNLFGALVAGLLFAGCALPPPYRSHPSLDAKANAIKTVWLLPPKVEVFQLDAGGVREEIREWSVKAAKNIASAVQGQLQWRGGLQVKSLPEDALPRGVKSNLAETYALFDAVNTSIILHTYSPPSPPDQLFSDKIKNFDYSLGKEAGRLGMGTDSIFVVSGADHVWTEGRQALQAFGILLGIGAGMVTGTVVIPVLGGGTAISVALVDAQSGAILWYSQAQAGMGFDLRDPTSVAGLVKGLLKDFPIGKEEAQEAVKEEQ